MARRALLLALLPTAGLSFGPPIVTGVVRQAVHTSATSWNHVIAAATDDRTFQGSPAQSLPWSRTPVRSRRNGLSMSLVEEAITADEAIALIGKAKTIVEADMGVKAADMLSEDFRFLWQFNGVLPRSEYLKEGTGPYATLRTAMPDMFWNSYDYRVDKYQKNRVWATTRLTGTHSGPLVFQGKEYPATGKRVEAAPECVSLVFDENSSLCTKMTGGFCLDRGAGNTGPAGSIWGVLQAIGEPVSAFSYFPPVKVLVDIFAPTFRPKPSTGTAKMPFREAIAVTLAKQVLSSKYDADALPGLLAEDAQIYAPILGPLKKKELIQSAEDLVGFFSGIDIENNWHDARVDAVEPSRLWITARPTAKVISSPLEAFGVKFEPKKQSYDAGPQTFSATFDSDGYISKLTLGCPMDTEIGDADGLTNFQGILAGLGIPVPEVFGRPAPESFRRLVANITPAGMKPKPKGSPKPKAVSNAKEGPSSKAKSTKGGSAGPSLPSMSSLMPKAAPKSKSTVSKPSSPKAAPTSAPPKETPKPAPKKPAAKATPKMAAPKSPPQKTAPKPAPKKPAPKKAIPKPAPVKSAASAKTSSAPGGKGQPSLDAKPSESSSPSSPFGGLFNFGGGSGSGTKSGEESEASKTEPASAMKRKSSSSPAPTPSKKSASKKAPPAKAPAPAPTPSKGKATPPSPVKGSGSVTFSPQLTEKLESALGSSKKLEQLSKRTDLYARGGISAMDYWSTLKSALGPDGAQNLGPDIIGSLPSGNQKKALFKLFSTG